MADTVGLVVLVGSVLLVLGGLPWLARRGRGGGGYTIMGPFDEMWHPAAVEARLEVLAQDERPAPAPSPGDPPGCCSGPTTAALRDGRERRTLEP
ncbi:hypothetical protein [Rhodococcus aerolatus]